MLFGARCARENKLEYEQLRAVGGPAYFVQADGSLRQNLQYQSVANVQYAAPVDLPNLGILRDRRIYTVWGERQGYVKVLKEETKEPFFARMKKSKNLKEARNDSR